MGSPQLSKVLPHWPGWHPSDLHPPPPSKPNVPPSMGGTLASAPPLVSPQPAMQVPSRHASPDAHVVPHAPQFWLSLFRSLQREVAPDPSELQTVWPAGHATAQVPAAVQTSVPTGQSAEHAPAEQVCPCEQTMPHPPQLKMSLLSWAHWLPHCTHPVPQLAQSRPPSGCPVVAHPFGALAKLQLATQLPAMHTSPVAQLTPHAPQWDGSDCRSWQNPVAPEAGVAHSS
jgi:hypothetical protein